MGLGNVYELILMGSKNIDQFGVELRPAIADDVIDGIIYFPGFFI